MMCQRIGRPPTSTIGFGRTVVSSARRVPRPPAKIMTFIGPALVCDPCLPHGDPIPAQPWAISEHIQPPGFAKISELTTASLLAHGGQRKPDAPIVCNCLRRAL